MTQTFKKGDVVKVIEEGVFTCLNTYGVVTESSDYYARCFWPKAGIKPTAQNEPALGWGIVNTRLQLVNSALAIAARTGDTVLHVPTSQTSEYAEDYAGHIGTIEGTHLDDPDQLPTTVLVKFSTGQYKSMLRSELLHLTDFKNDVFQVGQQIELVENSNGIPKGFIGKITQHFEKTQLIISIGDSIAIVEKSACKAITKEVPLSQQAKQNMEKENDDHTIKVGDTVKRINKKFHNLSIGDIYTVKEMYDGYVQLYKDGKDVNGMYDIKNFEKVYPNTAQPSVSPPVFAVGDRVKRIKEAHGYLKVGDEGLISAITPTGELKIEPVNSDRPRNIWAVPSYSTTCFVLVSKALKIGDVVTNTVQSLGVPAGKTGIVVSIDNNDNTLHVKSVDDSILDSCWLRIKDCVLVGLVEAPNVASDTPPIWDVGTLLRSTVSSFGGGVGKLGYVEAYDPSDNTYRLRRYEDSTRYFWVRANDCVLATAKDAPTASPALSTPTVKKGNTMSLKFETKHYINGINVNDFSPNDLVEAIAREESEIAKLKDVKSLPKRVKAEIDKREKNLRALVDFLDAQDDAATAATQPAV